MGKNDKTENDRSGENGEATWVAATSEAGYRINEKEQNPNR